MTGTPKKSVTTHTRADGQQQSVNRLGGEFDNGRVGGEPAAGAAFGGTEEMWLGETRESLPSSTTDDLELDEYEVDQRAAFLLGEGNITASVIRSEELDAETERYDYTITGPAGTAIVPVEHRPGFGEANGTPDLNNPLERMLEAAERHEIGDYADDEDDELQEDDEQDVAALKKIFGTDRYQQIALPHNFREYLDSKEPNEDDEDYGLASGHIDEDDLDAVTGDQQHRAVSIFADDERIPNNLASYFAEGRISATRHAPFVGAEAIAEEMITSHEWRQIDGDQREELVELVKESIERDQKIRDRIIFEDPEAPPIDLNRRDDIEPMYDAEKVSKQGWFSAVVTDEHSIYDGGDFGPTELGSKRQLFVAQTRAELILKLSDAGVSTGGDDGRGDEFEAGREDIDMDGETVERSRRVELYLPEPEAVAARDERLDRLD